MFRHVVSKRVDSSESLLPTSRDKVYEQVGVYSSYYILLVLSPKGDSKGPDRCSAKNNKTLVRKEPKGRMQSTITRIVCSALMPNVTCTDAERDCIDAECDVHNHADALRPPCFGDKTDGEEIVLSQNDAKTTRKRGETRRRGETRNMWRDRQTPLFCSVLTQ